MFHSDYKWPGTTAEEMAKNAINSMIQGPLLDTTKTVAKQKMAEKKKNLDAGKQAVKDLGLTVVTGDTNLTAASWSDCTRIGPNWVPAVPTSRIGLYLLQVLPEPPLGA